MNGGSQFWMIYFVAFADPSDGQEPLEPFVGKEVISSPSEAELSAFLRGGYLAEIVCGSESDAENARRAVEAEVLRR
ncbi:MAG: hypothetical protein NZ561_01100 [Phycisphaerae bacterium]|nr:hypothetical protein [Phycisphaerae bacterium]MDW8262154.1 hypothetical protein [Phycisphaerales bacterium]